MADSDKLSGQIIDYEAGAYPLLGSTLILSKYLTCVKVGNALAYYQKGFIEQVSVT